MTEHLSFEASEVFSVDQETRTIRGLAYPKGALTSPRADGRRISFSDRAFKFSERTPLLSYHDTSRPVGRLTLSEWTDRGQEVTFVVSKTAAGDEALQLAADGVLGLSVGVNGQPKTTASLRHFELAEVVEVSLTPVPAFSGAIIDSVALSAEEGKAMPENDALANAISALSEKLETFATPQTPETVAPVMQVIEEAPYRFDGSQGAYEFSTDLGAALGGNQEARNRLDQFISEQFAVTTGNISTLNPVPTRPDLFVGPLRQRRPLGNLISTGTITDATPFIVPKFNSATSLVADHVEGTEPGLGTYTATSQTITPAAISGKIEINREVLDQGGNPQVSAMVWTEMVQAYADKLEARIGAALNALTLTAKTWNGLDDDLVDAAVAELVTLQFTAGGERFSSLALNAGLYGDLVKAKDADGRKLLPILGATNADGTAAPGYGSITVGNKTGLPTPGLTTSSYLFVPTSVYQWSSAPRRLDFDVQVKSVFVGIWGYSAEAVTRTSDVMRITHAAA